MLGTDTSGVNETSYDMNYSLHECGIVSCSEDKFSGYEISY